MAVVVGIDAVDQPEIFPELAVDVDHMNVAFIRGTKNRRSLDVVIVTCKQRQEQHPAKSCRREDVRANIGRAVRGYRRLGPAFDVKLHESLVIHFIYMVRPQDENILRRFQLQ